MTTEQRKPDYQDLEERQMLLRFAGKAMGALIAREPLDREIDKESLADDAFEMAQAMVVEYHWRSKGASQP